MLTFSRAGYPVRPAFLLQDTQRVYRLCDFTKAQLIWPGVASLMAGKVNSASRLSLVIELVRPDTKHARSSTVPVAVECAGGSPID